MKIKIISDITLDPVIKKIHQITNRLEIDYDYVEVLPAYLMQYEPKGIDCILVYCDAVFHRYDKNMSKDIYSALLSLSGRTDVNIIVSNNIGFAPFPSDLSSGRGRFYINDKDLLDLDRQLVSARNTYFLDVHKVAATIGIANAYNLNLGYLYQMPYTKLMIEALAEEIVKDIFFMHGQEKKVILLDCDNTLWGGIIGEDGMDNLQCNRNAPGAPFFIFQKFLLSKKQEGFLLCLCSKNNESEVKEAFEKLNMPLRWDDFIIKKVNWEDKVTNITSIARELSLGIDSFIFIDDSEFEINSVAKILPEVTCIRFENSPDRLFILIDHPAFKRRFISAEDLNKTDQYVSESKRQQIMQESGSIEDYIKTLQIKLEWKENDMNNIERLSQMTGKTNQFNFNKQPYSPEQLAHYIKSGNKVYSLKVSDKFGDYGIVGLIMINLLNAQEAEIENYLMSCRALGRRIEYDFFKLVHNDLNQKQIKIKNIKFLETKKNVPAREFFNELKSNNLWK